MASTISDWDRAHVEDIVAGAGTNFSAHLLRLIAKADLSNREVLRSVYPDHVEAFETWYNTPMERSQT